MSFKIVKLGLSISVKTGKAEAQDGVIHYGISYSEDLTWTPSEIREFELGNIIEMPKDHDILIFPCRNNNSIKGYSKYNTTDMCAQITIYTSNWTKSEYLIKKNTCFMHLKLYSFSYKCSVDDDDDDDEQDEDYYENEYLLS
jgi:hypothetical protein